MTVFGLPLHPLIVHGAVVTIPVAALAALLVVAFPRVRRQYGWLTVAAAAAAAGAGLAARFTGPILADERGLTGLPSVSAHEAYGMWTPWPVLALALALPLFVRLAARPEGSGGRPGYVVTGAVVVGAAVASLVLILLTGHSGAAAVWGS